MSKARVVYQGNHYTDIRIVQRDPSDPNSWQLERSWGVDAMGGNCWVPVRNPEPSMDPGNAQRDYRDYEALRTYLALAYEFIREKVAAATPASTPESK